MLNRISSLLLIWTLLAMPTYAEEIYKHIDEQGVPSFSDTQTEGAEKITVEPITVQSIPTPQTAPAAPAQPTAQEYGYTRLEVINPPNQASLRDEHNILFQVVLEPELKQGHNIEFLDNGQPLQPAGENTSMELINFDRGTHQLSARILDKKGKVLKTSEPVTVYIFRTTSKPAPANPGG